MMTLPQRMLDKLGLDGTCWIWQGSRYPSGYAKVHWQGKKRLAHRVIYEILVGPIPEGLQIDHLCRKRECVNPAHMEPVSHGENIRRGSSVWGRNAQKTHCIRGHRLGGDNVNPSDAKNGTRDCRECNRVRSLEYQRKLRAAKAVQSGTL